jgi:hypothetical protein
LAAIPIATESDQEIEPLKGESGSIPMEGNDKTWKCTTCGESHSDVPLSFAADFPDMYANLNSEDRDLRAVIGSDQCIVDEQWFFIRGCLEIPAVVKNLCSQGDSRTGE